MNITLTLPEDVSIELSKAAAEAGTTVTDFAKSLICEVVLSKHDYGLCREKPFSQRVYPLGIKPGFDWNQALELAGEMEDEHIRRSMTVSE